MPESESVSPLRRVNPEAVPAARRALRCFEPYAEDAPSACPAVVLHGLNGLHGLVLLHGLVVGQYGRGQHRVPHPTGV